MSTHATSCQRAATVCLLACAAGSARAAELGVQQSRFTIDGVPTFLMGVSYYGALGASEEFIGRDLDDMRRSGFNWIRVWATWAAFQNNVSAVDGDGRAREPFLDKLRWLLAECDRRGMIVDVTLSRGNGTTGPPRLQSIEAHRRAVEALVTTLRPYRNWYLDMANERNIRDKRFVSFAELRQLRDAVKKMDPTRLVTASQAGDVTQEVLREYLATVQVDFIALHRPRNPAASGQCEAQTRTYLRWMKDLNRVVPVHYQEPFRRGFRTRAWEPPAEAFLADAKGAIAGGAAGWCFHNGNQSDQPEEKPRRSFDMTERRLFDQLDAQEQEAIRLLSRLTAGGRATAPASSPGRIPG